MMNRLLQIILLALSRGAEGRSASAVRESQQSASKNHPATPIAVTVTSELKLPQALVDAQRADENKQKSRDRVDRVRLGVEVAVLLAVAVGFWFNWHQLDAARQSVDVANKSADAAVAAAKAANASIDAMREQITVARDANLLAQAGLAQDLEAFKQVQRARLNITGFRLDKEPTEGDAELRITTMLKNVGPTIATGVLNRHFILVAPAHANVTKRQDFSRFPTREGTNVYPGVDGLSIAASLPIESSNTEAVAAYRSRKNRLFLWSRYDYRDVFNNPHWMEICVFHDFGQPLTEFIECAGGQASDEDQPSPKTKGQRNRQP